MPNLSTLNWRTCTVADWDAAWAARERLPDPHLDDRLHDARMAVAEDRERRRESGQGVER